MPVVGTDWLHACTKVNLRVPFNTYFTPALKDCTLSFTNLAKRARSRFQKDIEALGGSVAPDMSKKCSHLVVGDASKPSSKLRCVSPEGFEEIMQIVRLYTLRNDRIHRAANEWAIPVITLSWLEKTIQTKKIIPLSSYRVTLTSSAPSECRDLPHSRAQSVMNDSAGRSSRQV